MDGYTEFRGKCKPMSEAAVAADPTLTLVRGHYHCPIWGEQPHWWCKRPDEAKLREERRSRVAPWKRSVGR